MSQAVVEKDSQQLQTVESQLAAYQEQFQQVLPANVPPDRIMRTVLVSCQNNPQLLECDRGSLLQSAMSAAVLGLEVDGVTGQGYLIPFKGRAQFIPGFKGFQTLADRAGYTINSAVVREGDAFDYRIGTEGYVDHRPELGDEAKRRIRGAWATATHPQREPVVTVVSIDEIEAIRAKAPGAKKQDSPWNDPTFYPRMAEKTAIRRLASRMPLATMQSAAAVEDALEAGKPTHLTPDGGRQEPEPAHRDAQPDGESLTEPSQYRVILKDGSSRGHPTPEQWKADLQAGIEAIQGSEKLSEEQKRERLAAMLERNADAIDEVFQEAPEAADSVREQLRQAAEG